MYKKMSVVASLFVMGVSLLTAATASAELTGEYAAFKQCPTNDPSVMACVVATTESGEFVVGKKTVPITKTITLQGGTYFNKETKKTIFVGAKNGETLSKTPENVPGGLAGLVNCTEISFYLARIACEAVFENGLTGVSATTELAGSASEIALTQRNFINEEGVALAMPVKVHLENTFLGEECYVGSNSAPIELELTTGTTSPPPPNEPIKGSKGTQEVNAEGTILSFSKNSLVDNSFEAPGANGCGGILSFLIDPIIESSMGIPSAAGYNTAILNGTLKQAGALLISEKEA